MSVWLWGSAVAVLHVQLGSPLAGRQPTLLVILLRSHSHPPKVLPSYCHWDDVNPLARKPYLLLLFSLGKISSFLLWCPSLALISPP